MGDLESETLGEILEIVGRTKRIGLQIRGGEYLIHDLKRGEVVSNGTVYDALKCARGYAA